jgi:hypothetical protein
MGRPSGAARCALLIGMLGGLWCSTTAVQAACPPPGHTAASLQALKTAQWQLPEPGADAARQALAVALLDCLPDPDPGLRDGVAFEALQAWMRGQQLSTATVQALRVRLMAALAAPADSAGFGQPFAALALAEVARVDRRQPFLSADERATLVTQATRYLAGVRDYRGFDAREGWRHGVAHGADLLLQLSLNPALTPPQAQVMRQAIAAQVLPSGEHAYRFGEPERLAAPVFYLARRDDWLAGDWTAWFDALLARWPRGTAPTAQSLAQRHNLVAFVSALYVAVQESPDAAVQARLLPGLRKALRGLD